MVKYQDVHAAHRPDRFLRQPVHSLAGSDIRHNADRARCPFGPRRRRVAPTFWRPTSNTASRLPLNPLQQTNGSRLQNR
jgi:hypothetical protein